MRRISSILAVVLAVAALALPARAVGGISIDPINVTIGAGARTGTLTFGNNGLEPRTLQLSVHVWEQVDGHDRTVPTEDVIVAPTIFRMQPGASQIVRIGTVSASHEMRERSYRLVATEVPSEVRPRGMQAALMLSFSLPIFIAPSNASQSKLEWSARRIDATHVSVTARNTGNAHEKIDDVRLTGGSAVYGSMLVGDYVLPEATKSWTVKLAQPIVGSAVTIVDGHNGNSQRVPVTM